MPKTRLSFRVTQMLSRFLLFKLQCYHHSQVKCPLASRQSYSVQHQLVSTKPQAGPCQENGNYPQLTLKGNAQVAPTPKGTLLLTLIEGKLTRDLDNFTKMDVYAVVELGGRKFQTQVHQEAGKAPKWNKTLEIPIYNASEPIRITVMDKDLTNDDEIGSLSLKTIDYLNALKKPPQWVNIQFEGKTAGQISIQTQYQETGQK